MKIGTKILIKILISCLFLINPVSSWSFIFDIIPENENLIIAGVLGEDLWNSNAWLFKIDQKGEILWSRIDKSNCTTHPWNLIKTHDGYVLGGIIVCPHKTKDGWIAKIDHYGNKLWERTYGFDGFGDSVTTIDSHNDSIIAGITINPCNEEGENKCLNTDSWLVNISDEGKELWKKELDFRDYDSIKKIKKVSNGYLGVISLGDIRENTLFYESFGILFFDLNGNLLLKKEFNFGYNEYGWDIVETEDGYCIAGTIWDVDLTKTTEASDVKSHAFVLKLNKNLDTVFIKNISINQITTGWSLSPDCTVLAGTGGFYHNNSVKKFVYVYNLSNQELFTIERDFLFMTEAIGIAKVVKVKDGYVLLSNILIDSNSKAWVTKVDLGGNFVWERFYPDEYLKVNESINEPTEKVESFQIPLPALLFVSILFILLAVILYLIFRYLL
ncbi:MAG: hypothetical protein QXN49_07585 [Archaeoglobaceae archaeon]